MRRDPDRTIVDYSKDLVHCGPPGGTEARIRISFDVWSSREIMVEVSGLGINLLQRNRYRGILHSEPGPLNQRAEELRGEWSKLFDYQVDSGTLAAHGPHPFTDEVDLRRARAADVDSMWRSLARQGYYLLGDLFGGDDLANVRDRLFCTLRDGPRAVTVHADALFIPWSMLYLPPRPDFEFDDLRQPLRLDGFFGYQHLVEESLDEATDKDWQPRIHFVGKPHAGAHVDRELDKEYPVVTPVLDVLLPRTHCKVRPTRAVLYEDIRAGLTDHIMYFCCHNERDDRHSLTSSIRLEKDLNNPAGPEVTVLDIRDWLTRSRLRNTPIVFMNACEGGRAAVGAFSGIFLQGGANSLIGPEIPVPFAFAAAFGVQFFEAFLQPGTPVGRLSRHLARYFADEFLNPFGLTYSLYNAIDTMLWTEQPDERTASPGTGL